MLVLTILFLTNAYAGLQFGAVVAGKGEVAVKKQISQYECSPVDLRSTIGPVRDQQDLGNCYAQTATDVLSQAIRQSQKGTLARMDSISVAQTTFRYKSSKNQKTLSDGGDVKDALDALIADGRICTEMSEFNTSAAKKSDIYKLDSKAMLEAIQEKCKKTLNGTYKVNSQFFADKDALIETLNRALNQGRLAGITYNPSFLLKSPNGAHASSIVGRKMINGECHYLLRNSWGLSCKPYNETYAKKCNAGYIWVDESSLKSHSSTVDYIPATQAQQDTWKSIQPTTYNTGPGNSAK